MTPDPAIGARPPLATAAQVAAFLQTRVDSPAQDRYRRRGLPYVKVSGRSIQSVPAVLAQRARHTGDTHQVRQ